MFSLISFRQIFLVRLSFFFFFPFPFSIESAALLVELFLSLQISYRLFLGPSIILAPAPPQVICPHCVDI